VGNKLYTFDSNGRPPHYLCEQPALNYDGGYDSGDQEVMFTMRGQIMEWAWKTGPSPLPGSGASYVKSYAVHPDGRAIFVSHSIFYGNPILPFTFSLDTEHGGWTRRGDWTLPFQGRAYYDGHLDAWVGIREAEGDGTECENQGSPYLCPCDVPDLPDVNGDQPPEPLPAPEWKMCKEELTFFKGALSRAFVHTGRGRFCLLEVTRAREIEAMDDCDEDLLRVTTFCAKHGKNGELLVAPCRHGRSYFLPPCFADPLIAFWM
uniref:DUF1618 domain-containing protein n=2 Tax=Aegilops tauschii TaxID=37682 RepID=A0A453MLM7_AEGTS